MRITTSAPHRGREARGRALSWCGRRGVLLRRLGGFFFPLVAQGAAPLFTPHPNLRGSLIAAGRVSLCVSRQHTAAVPVVDLCARGLLPLPHGSASTHGHRSKGLGRTLWTRVRTPGINKRPRPALSKARARALLFRRASDPTRSPRRRPSGSARTVAHPSSRRWMDPPTTAHHPLGQSPMHRLRGPGGGGVCFWLSR